MNENAMIVGVAICGLLYYGSNNYINSNKEIEFSKSGLEQCMDKDGKVLWVKECKNDNNLTKVSNAKN
jgi:hypothetical protein